MSILYAEHAGQASKQVPADVQFPLPPVQIKQIHTPTRPANGLT
jgi:hypothetical protein